MKIRELTKEYAVDVYAIYWAEGMRSHLVVPYDGYDGLLVVRENKCEIVDPSLNGFILRKSGDGRDMLVHWAAEKDDLLDRLIDPPDSDAIVELYRRLREDRPPF